MKKALLRVARVLPIYIFGFIAGLALMTLLDMWSPSWWDYVYVFGIVFISLVIAILWINTTIK